MELLIKLLLLDLHHFYILIDLYQIILQVRSFPNGFGVREVKLLKSFLKIILNVRNFLIYPLSKTVSQLLYFGDRLVQLGYFLILKPIKAVFDLLSSFNNLILSYFFRRHLYLFINSVLQLFQSILHPFFIHELIRFLFLTALALF